MGKIVKYCTACEESFTEKFSFCPICASELSAFEMRPVAGKKEPERVPEPEAPPILRTEEQVKETSAIESEPEVPAVMQANEPVQESRIIESKSEAEPDIPAETASPVSFEAPDEVAEAEVRGSEAVFATEAASADDHFRDEWVQEEIEDAEAPVVEVPADVVGIRTSESKTVAAGTFLGLLEVEDKSGVESTGFEYDPEELARYDYDQDPYDENYKVTVISDRTSNTRTSLFLGAFVIIFFGFLGLIVYSLFTNLSDVASLVDEGRFVAMLDDVPMDIDEEKPKEEDDDDGGGGGGGGKNEDKPVSKGELVTQTRPPMMPPSPTIPRLTNPSLPVIMSTEGDIKRNRIEAPGLPNALSTDPSSGPGSGGGMGTGAGSGMGSGFGTGEGSGTGSGSGAGNGDGNGDGTDRGGRRPPPVRSGPTTGLNVTYKPRPGYTDEARQNNVRGTVILRVTFLANGSIGSVSTVKGLGYGLTEKAIAAARQMRFTPAMRNGQPQTVNKVVHFNFTIY